MKLNYIAIIGGALLLTACANVKHSWCPPEEVVQHQVGKETIKLSADALFKFDKSGLNDLLPQGKAELDEVIAKLNSRYVTVQKIDITGHTDRLGSEQYNYDLGLKRAETVRRYLLANGVETQLNVSSRGESEPVTQSCSDADGRAALKACLQPDRRVSLEITGVQLKNQ